MTDRARELEAHEQELKWLLDELGRVLAQRERLFDRERRRHNGTRMERITEEAQRPFAELDRDTLVERLEQELEHQRVQEQELRGVLDTLRLQHRLEDQLFEELKRYVFEEHRDELFEEIERQFARRGEIFGGLEQSFEGIEQSSLQKTRKRLTKAVDCQRELERLIFKAIERHLVRIHQDRERP